jgi:hypothetical protein
MSSQTEPVEHEPEPHAGEREDESLWSAYWERFRRQQVDDPVEDRREGYWDRFRRQDVDDPVGPREPGRPAGRQRETR